MLENELVVDEYDKQQIHRKYRVTQIHPVIWKRIFLSEPDLHKMIDGVIFIRRNWEMEILTTSPNYPLIWECLKKDYPVTDYPVRLNCMGYDENLHYYCVDVFAPHLMEFIRFVHKIWNEKPYMKEQWIKKFG